ncbi:hypothetical protein JXM67_06710 [candidate division WOR-3 bacterium]|nr:hypothetical protein [candidate division WOR-3 bacterium]
MKRFSPVIIIFTSTLVALPLSAGWWQTYGTEGDEIGLCVQQTSDEGYIISGHSFPLTGCWIIKTDEQGEIEWTKNYQEKIFLGGLCIQQTSDGGYIVTVGVSLLKLDENGDKMWVVQDEGLAGEMEWIEETSDGGYIATGMVLDLTAGDVTQLVLVRMDNQGSVKWRYAYNIYPDVKDGGSCVRETSDGGYIVCGWRDDLESLWLIKTDSLGHKEWDLYDTLSGWGSCVEQASDGGYIVSCDYCLLKINAEGQVQWKKEYGEGADLVYCFVQTQDGGYVSTGAKYPAGQSAWEARDPWLFKTDAEGNLAWERTYGGDRQDAGYSVKHVNDGGYIVAGVTSSIGAGGDDFYLIKTDAEGLVEMDEERDSAPALSWKVEHVVGSQIVLKYANHLNGLHTLIFDTSGRKVDEIRTVQPSGTVTWGKGHSPGVYFIRGAASPAPAQKVVLVR